MTWWTSLRPAVILLMPAITVKYRTLIAVNNHCTVFTDKALSVVSLATISHRGSFINASIGVVYSFWRSHSGFMTVQASSELVRLENSTTKSSPITEGLLESSCLIPSRYFAGFTLGQGQGGRGKKRQMGIHSIQKCFVPSTAIINTNK